MQSSVFKKYLLIGFLSIAACAQKQPELPPAFRLLIDDFGQHSSEMDLLRSDFEDSGLVLLTAIADSFPTAKYQPSQTQEILKSDKAIAIQRRLLALNASGISKTSRGDTVIDFVSAVKHRGLSWEAEYIHTKRRVDFAVVSCEDADLQELEGSCVHLLDGGWFIYLSWY